MNIEIKNQIIAAVTSYMDEKFLTAADVAKKTKINTSYISQLLRGQYVTNAGNKTVEIADKYFNQLADFIGLKIEKPFWHIIPTEQFVSAITHLENAKEYERCGIIIGYTGSSKTTAVERFMKNHPVHTYLVTVNKLDTLPTIMERLLEAMGLNEKGRSANKLSRIIKHLQRLKHEGEKVIIILDEAENFKVSVFGMVKALYDGIINYASIMLIGTPELTDKMEKMKRADKDGMPQFCRRFKAGTLYLSPIDKRCFVEFFEKVGIEDKDFRKLLLQEADNYGELHDYLEPALKEADRLNQPLTEDFFRLFYNMPKHK